MPPAVRQADDAWHDLVGHGHGNDDRLVAATDLDSVAGLDLQAFGILGMQQRHALVRAAVESADIVHPGIDRVKLAPSDHDHAVAVDVPGHRHAQARHFLHQQIGCQLDLAAGRAQRLRQPLEQGAQVDAVLCRLDLRQREAIWVGAELVAEVMGAQENLVDAVAALLGLQQRRRFRRGLAAEPAAGLRALQEVAGQRIVHVFLGYAGYPCGQPQHDLAVGPGVGQRFEHFIHPLGDVAYRERRGEDRPVGTVQVPRTRQNQIGMAAGFANVDVASCHEVQRGQRLRQPRAVGRADHRIGANRQQATDLARSWREHFLRHRDDRELAGDFRQPAHAREPAVMRRDAALVTLVEENRGRHPHRNHGAARTVEIAGDGIDHIDQPARH